MSEQLEIRSYCPQDYPVVKKLYQVTGLFDPETDAQHRLDAKAHRDPASLLVAVQQPDIVGTVSLIEDGRVAIFFRLVAIGAQQAEIRAALLAAGQQIFGQRGYKEIHIMAPEQDYDRQRELHKLGYKTGRDYRWMWRNVTE